MCRLIVYVHLTIPICHDKDTSGVIVHQVFQPCSARLDVRDHLEGLHICQLEAAVLRYRVDEPKGSIRIDTHDPLGMSFQQLSLQG